MAAMWSRLFKRSAGKAKADAPLQSGDAHFLSGVYAAHINESLPRVTWILYLLLVVVASAITWASIATVDEVIRCEARVVPDGRDQIIASLEGGLLRELYVQEGMQVQAGQELVKLDPTRVEAQQHESQAKRLALRASVARLTAESEGHAIKFPEDVAKEVAAVRGETDIYNSRKRVLDESVAAINRSMALLQKELSMAQTMAARGLMSNVEVMRLNRQVNELAQSRTERISRFKQEAATDLVRVQTELSQLDEQLIVRQDMLKRTVLTSPVHGLVKNIRVGTVGGVIGPGATIMEIVPLGPRTLIEARIKPKDVGFVQVGQGAKVKFTGYDYNTYGGLEGKVEYISPDAFGDTEKAGGAEASFYRTMVRSEKNTLKAKGQPLPVIPGMTATLEIRTGQRSVLSFLLRPMLKSKDAMTERG